MLNIQKNNLLMIYKNINIFVINKPYQKVRLYNQIWVANHSFGEVINKLAVIYKNESQIKNTIYNNYYF